MNEILRQLQERKSVRVFTDAPITPEERMAILSAAVQAPTAGNQQLYTILEITEEARKKRLAELCDHQPFIAEAPLVLVFCADCQKWVDAFTEAGSVPRKSGVGDLLLAVTDAAIAAQNAVTAAWSLGIGSCYIGDVMENCEAERELLELPAYVFPAVMVVFGRPTAQQCARKKPARLSVDDVVCRNTYQRRSAEELRRMYAPRCGEQGYDAWMRKFCARKYNSDFAREMTRSVAEYLKAFATGEEEISNV